VSVMETVLLHGPIQVTLTLGESLLVTQDSATDFILHS